MTGVYYRSLSKDMRLTIPGAFLQNNPQQQAKVVISPSDNLECCLKIYFKTEKEIRDEILTETPESEINNHLESVLIKLITVAIDSRSRIKIPRSLAKEAKITPGCLVVCAGVGTYFEVWAKEAWDSTMCETDEINYIDILSELDL